MSSLFNTKLLKKKKKFLRAIIKVAGVRIPFRTYMERSYNGNERDDSKSRQINVYFRSYAKEENTKIKFSIFFLQI